MMSDVYLHQYTVGDDEVVAGDGDIWVLVKGESWPSEDPQPRPRP